MLYRVVAFDGKGQEIGATNVGSQRMTLEHVARTRLTQDGASLVELKAIERGEVIAHKTVKTVLEVVAFFNNK